MLCTEIVAEWKVVYVTDTIPGSIPLQTSAMFKPDNLRQQS